MYLRKQLINWDLSYLIEILNYSAEKMFTDKRYRTIRVFQIATLDWIIGRDEMPDVINCHDHHTGLIPFMMLYCGKYRKLQNTPSMIDS
jgi:glycogen synthase